MKSNGENTRGEAQRRLWMLLAAASCALFAHPAMAQVKPRIIDQKPFDRMVLQKNDQVLKLRPLELEPRRPLGDQAPDFKLRLRLYGKKERYEVEWKDVKEVTLFEELVLAEASALRDAEKFEAAYEYYVFLEQRDAKFPGVAKAFSTCLFREAEFWIKQDRLDVALSLLNEVHRRDADYAGLSDALSRTVDSLVRKHFLKRRFAAARELIEQLSEKFPQHPIVRTWSAHLVKSSEAGQRAAQAAIKAGNYPAAYLAAKQAVELWPKLESSQKLLAQLRTKHPIVTVGVTTNDAAATRGEADQTRTRLANWGTQRIGRLLHRRIAEPVAAGDHGLRYDFPVADIKQTATGVSMQIHPDVDWTPSGGSLGAVDIARRVLAATKSGDSDFHPHLAALVQAVKTVGDRRVDLNFAWKHPRPNGLLQMSLRPWHAPLDAQKTPTLGPYHIVQRKGKSIRFRRRVGYFAAEEGQAEEVVEQRFANAATALGSLVRGELVALDRIEPWDVTRFQAQEGVNVRAYAVPAVHLLIPNMARPLPADSVFRRAVAHGIQRRRILQETLLQDEDARRGRIADTPFPTDAKTELDLEPLPYDPRMMLAAMRLKGRQPDDPDAGSTNERLRIKILHPATSVARRACQQIKQHLELEGLGPVVELREASTLPSRDADWDFCYFEWSMCDPLIDAPRLFAEIGAGSVVQQSLLRWAHSKPETALVELRKLKELLHDQQTVIPLWRLTEHYATHVSLQGVGEGLCNLYQNVESWRLSTADEE